MGSVKVFQKGCFSLEDSSWGAAPKALTGQIAIPYLSLGKRKTVNFEADNSIDTQAFKDVPRKVTEYGEESISTYARFSGLSPLLYWSFGFETTNTVIVLRLEDDPTIGNDDVYLDSALESFSFLRVENIPKGKVYIFEATANVTGTTLNKESGTGPDTLTIVESSNIMCEHIFELDRKERHRTLIKDDEADFAGYTIGAYKNRMAGIGVNLLPNQDISFPKSMCKSFSFKSEAAKFAEIAVSFISKDQVKGNFSSAGWTFDSNLQDSDSIVAHHQLEVAIGANEAGIANYGVSSLEMGFEIPLPVQQDTTSGINIIEPVMEGKYTISSNVTLSRYSSDAFQTYRDNWTSCQARVSGFNDFLRTDIFIHNAKISDAGPDESNIAQEVLALEVGGFGVNNWPIALRGNTVLQKSPILMRVRDFNFNKNMVS
jgi:hypothetical protein